MSRKEDIEERRKELIEEEYYVNFFESNVFPYFEKKYIAELQIFYDILYNSGKATIRPSEINRINAARVEIKIRKDFLDLFRESRERYSRVKQEVQELEKQNNGK